MVEYACDEYCDMASTLVTCNSRAGIAARECVPRYPVDVIQTLMCFSDWSSYSVRKEVLTHESTDRPGAVGAQLMKVS
jgi:hypothetical protein